MTKRDEAVKLLAEVLSVAHGKGPMWQHERQADAILAELRRIESISERERNDA